MWLALAALLAPAGAFAQQAGGQAIPGVDAARQWYIERIGDAHWKLTGDVEIDKDDTKIFADEVEIFTDRDLLLARGNVTVTTPTQRISADSLEFNTKTKLGTFHHASGSALLHPEQEPPAEKRVFGTQEPEVLFYGETLEKIGEKRYRITDGGFTTCVQPKPRWEITSGTVILNIDHYAMLQNSLMRVKGLPVLYLPIMYYPINKEDRATGFLLPMYTDVDAQGEHHQQRVLLGDQPQPGRDVQLRLVLEDGPRVRQRVPLRPLAVLVGRRAVLHAERAAHHRARRHGRHGRRGGAAQFRRSRRTWPRTSRSGCGAACASTTSPTSRSSGPTTPTSTTRRGGSGASPAA